MKFSSFQELFDSMAGGQRKRTAVVWAEDDHTMEAAAEVCKAGCIAPIFIGRTQELEKRWKELKVDFSPRFVPATSAEEAVKKAVEMARSGEAELIQKGLVETAVIMRQIVHKENGLCQEGLLSHLTVVELPNYHKLLGLTDCALLTYPTLEQKKEAIRNALIFFHSVGYEDVKVGILAAVEKVNPKMPETVEAVQLKDACIRGELPGSTVEGPISYDLAMVREAAEIKGYKSPVAGDADLLVVPNITAGNILVKSLSYSAGGSTAAVVLGAKVPVAIASRSSPVRSKIMGLRLAAAMAQGLSDQRR